MGAKDHRESAESHAVRCAVLVVSDSRTEKSDASGKLAVALIRKAGHEAADPRIVPNDGTLLREAIDSSPADVVVTIGGTGPSARDLTIETVRPLLAKELPGFGELFRARSLTEIGTATILTRALLGVLPSGRVVACAPGSAAAVRLALEDILLPELKHLVWDVRRYRENRNPKPETRSPKQTRNPKGGTSETKSAEAR